MLLFFATKPSKLFCWAIDNESQTDFLTAILIPGAVSPQEFFIYAHTLCWLKAWKNALSTPGLINSPPWNLVLLASCIEFNWLKNPFGG